MKARSYWNADHDVCVIHFDIPTTTIGQCPFNAVNYALETFYNQSSVVDPFPMTVWVGGDKQWGILVAEAMNLDDDQAYALATSIVESDQTSPYDIREWEF